MARPKKEKSLHRGKRFASVSQNWNMSWWPDTLKMLDTRLVLCTQTGSPRKAEVNYNIVSDPRRFRI